MLVSFDMCKESPLSAMESDEISLTVYSISLYRCRKYDSKERRVYAAFLIHQLVLLPRFVDSCWQDPLCA